MAKRWHEHGWQGPSFVENASFDAGDKRYYEQIIAEDNQVPTRETSWHDLFNALIWIQFPKTKQWLNQLHMKDISEKGVHPRTPERNRITHFDECGVVLAVPADKLALVQPVLQQLDSHNWGDVFLTHRHMWGEGIVPVIFGHAIFEMLLNPYIGLTGKWFAVVVPAGYGALTQPEQMDVLDDALKARIQILGNFTRSPLLKPLPILGVPGWWNQQTAAFYANEAYFRPRRAEAKISVQLPLRCHQEGEPD